MSEASVRWPATTLAALAVVAPLNVKLTSESWTELQLRILIVVGFVVALAIVVHGILVPSWRRPDRVEWIAFAWLTAIWLSALTSDAPTLGSAGAARLTVPILLIVATRMVIRDNTDAKVLLRSIGVGTVLGAAIGLAVWAWGEEVAATRIFVGETTKLGPMNRLTRPWGHANIAAAVFGTTIACITTWRRRSLAAGALVMIVIALVLTISRGGLLSGVAVGVVWVAVRRRKSELLAVGGLFLVAALVFVSSSAWASRVEQLGDEAFYASSIDPPAEFSVDAEGTRIQVVVSNRSQNVWMRTGDDRVLISARWFGPDGLIWVEDEWPLPADLPAGEVVTVPLDVAAQLPTGDYELRWDLVLPDTVYFGQFLGEEPIMSAAQVTTSPVAVTDVESYELVTRTVRLSRTEIWRVAWEEFKDAPLLGVGPNQFGSAAVAGRLDANQRPAAHAHNVVLEPLATWGLFGSVPFLLLFVGAFVRVAMLAWRTRALVATVVTVGLAAFFVHGVVDWPLVAITTGIPIGLLVGLAWSDAVSETPS